MADSENIPPSVEIENGYYNCLNPQNEILSQYILKTNTEKV